MASNDSGDSGPSQRPVPLPRKRNILVKEELVEKQKFSLVIINKINKLIKQYADQFYAELSEAVDDFDSEEDFVESSELLLEQIFVEFKSNSDVNDGQFLDSFLIRLKDKTNKILNEFREQIRNREPKPTHSISGIEKGITQLQLTSKTEAEEKPEEVEPSEAIYENLIDIKYCSVDPTNSIEANPGFKPVVNNPDHSNYLRFYRSRLRNSIDFPFNETTVELKHKELKTECIRNFQTNELGSDVQLFSQMIEQCFEKIKLELYEKNAKILSCLKKAMDFYINTMEECLQKKPFYPENSIIELQTNLKDMTSDQLKELCKNSFGDDFDFDELLDELNRRMRKEFQRFNDKNELAKNNSEKLIKEKITESIKVYEQHVHSLIKTVENLDELENKNEIFKNQLKLKFVRDNYTFTPDIIEVYLQELDSGFTKSYGGAEALLNWRLNKEEEAKERNLNNIRIFYEQKMKDRFQLKKFYFKKTLIGFHELIVKQTVDCFKLPETFIRGSVVDIYQEFEELNARNTPKEPAIGIDLGTTNSVVAYFTPGLKLANSTVVITNELGNDTTPSVVSFRDNNEVCVGIVAKQEEEIYPHNTIHSAKRFIGQTFAELKKNKNNVRFMENLQYRLADIDNRPKICVKVDASEKQYFPEEISAKVLLNLKAIAEKYLKDFRVKKVVITVPAYFNDSQKEATKQAGKLAGLDVLRIINEPTAAAIAFRIDQSSELSEKIILIFDFGGGTLDVAIVRLVKGDIVVSNVKGDNYLGGEDIDNNLVEYCLASFQKKIKKNFNKKELPVHRLRRVCEEAKIKLSSVKSTNITIKNFYQDYDLDVELTRDKFDDINKNIFEKAISLVKDAISDAKLKFSDIKEIVLVGGSTRIKKIQKMLTKLFNNSALNHRLNPDTSVAVGAAIHAATLNGQSAQERIFNFTDVTPMSLGLKNAKNEMFFLIHKNTKLPHNVTKPFLTQGDTQKQVRIAVYEGENKLVQDNNLLGEFTLEDLPPGKKGEVKIDVTFDVNEEGILTVSAKCDQIESELVIKEHRSRLTEEQVEDLIKKGELEIIGDQENDSKDESNNRISGLIKKVKSLSPNNIEQKVASIFYDKKQENVELK